MLQFSFTFDSRLNAGKNHGVTLTKFCEKNLFERIQKIWRIFLSQGKPIIIICESNVQRIYCKTIIHKLHLQHFIYDYKASKNNFLSLVYYIYF
jgi:hypothetical protein